METLKNQTQAFFTREQVTGEGQATGSLEKNILAYNKTGRFELPQQEFTSMDETAMLSSGAMSPSNVMGSNQTTSPMMR